MCDINIPNSISTGDLLKLMETKQKEEKVQNMLKNLVSKGGNFMSNLKDLINEIKDENTQENSSGIFVVRDKDPLFIPSKLIFVYLKEYKLLGNSIGEKMEKVILKTDIEDLSMSDVESLGEFFALNHHFEEFCLNRYKI